MLKIVSIHTDCDARRRPSSNLRTSNERCQFKLCMFNENMDDELLLEAVRKEEIIYNDNDVIDSLMNMHKLLASRSM